MTHIQHKNGALFIEDIAIESIASRQPTPFYVYSSAQLERNVVEFQSVLSGLDCTVCFAVKANSNQAVLKTFAQLGCGADVVSLGELKRALNAGISADKIVFSGVGKTPTEIEYALQQGIFQFNVESLAELLTIDAIAQQCQLIANIALRINPDVAVDTHAKITTGTAENKFGIAFEDAFATFVAADKLSHIKVQGIHVHIGSQITDVSPYREAFKRVAELHRDLANIGIEISVLDLGGGIGVNYNPATDPLPDMQLYRDIIEQELAHIDCHFIFEPGRSLTANAGCLVSKVIYEKRGHHRNFLIIDAAMNDFARPSLYDAFHHISAVTEVDSQVVVYDVVGPVCESGDTFAVQRTMPMLKANDLVMIHDCGAYGAVMASTYNSRPLIAEIMVKNDAYAVIRQQQDLDELIGLDCLPDWLCQTN